VPSPSEAAVAVSIIVESVVKVVNPAAHMNVSTDHTLQLLCPPCYDLRLHCE
jgi:hypothetical protein